MQASQTSLPFAPSTYFGIRVVDAATGRGVPLAELTTNNQITYVTDSNGWAAINEIGLMGNETFFALQSHGYIVPKDGFGYAGVRLTPQPGRRVSVKITPQNIAERMCRLTGGGIYHDSVLLKEPTPLQNPLLSGGVLGQDSALAVVYKGKMLWFWGDTNRTSYPLGNFHTSGAIATLPAGQKTASRGLDFRYFTGPDGFVRAMCPSEKPGPIWVFGVVVIGSGQNETLIAHYTRVKDLGNRYEHGMVQWDDNANVFRVIKEFPLTEKWAFLDGHPLRTTENGTEYLLSGFSVPNVRVPAKRDAVLDTQNYEAFTCLNERGEILLGADKTPVYRWQKAIGPISSEQEAQLVEQKKLRPQDAHFLPRDEKGSPIILHGGTVTWNPFRKKWLLIATQKGGTSSALGEIFYGEADTPTGPWKRAVKIITHEKYTFYNPVHHPFLDEPGSRAIYIEGTYTNSFSGNPQKTPRYDYNQILYRLDLTDSRLRWAQAG